MDKRLFKYIICDIEYTPVISGLDVINPLANMEKVK